MSGPPYKIEEVRVMAEGILAELQGFCERIEIAGSIRRGRAYCNDIDLVCLPKGDEDAGRSAAGATYGFVHALKERCKRNSQVVTDGDMNLIVRMKNGVQLDIFIARRESRDLLRTTPSNYGSLLLCRTGSVRHNIFLVERAKRLGKVWNPYYGVFVGKSGQCIASATEEDIFKALELDFVAPEKRER
jgi:DNA polymerase (family 10)